MTVVAITNQKGGSGKTTTAVNLAAALAENGKRVLVVDLDAQTSASTWLGVQDDEDALLGVLAGQRALASAVRSTAFTRVDVVPASGALATAERALASEVGAELMLRHAIASLPRDRWDFILLDCPPTLGLLSVAALAASDEVLVPVEAHVMALAGLASLVQTVERVQHRLSPRLRLTAILACRVDSRKNLCQDVIATLRDRFGHKVLQSVVRENVRLAEAPSFSQPITFYDAKSTGADDYRAVAAELLKRSSDVRPRAKPRVGMRSSAAAIGR